MFGYNHPVFIEMENEINMTNMPKELQSSGALKSTISLVVLVALVAGGFVAWKYIEHQKARQEEAKIREINGTAAGLVSELKISFPNISSNAWISTEELPEEDRLFIYADAVGVTARRIEYSDSRTGVFLDYTVPNSKIEDFLTFNITLNLLMGNEDWKVLGSTHTNVVGILEMENVNTDSEAQLRYIQRDADVQVIVKTIKQ